MKTIRPIETAKIFEDFVFLQKRSEEIVGDGHCLYELYEELYKYENKTSKYDVTKKMGKDLVNDFIKEYKEVLKEAERKTKVCQDVIKKIKYKLDCAKRGEFCIEKNGKYISINSYMFWEEE